MYISQNYQIFLNFGPQFGTKSHPKSVLFARIIEIEDGTWDRFHVNTTSPAFFSKTNIVFDASIAATLTRLSQQG